MKKDEILKAISMECKRAERIHPIWPSDIIHQTAIMVEEAGETLKAALEVHFKENKTTIEKVKSEAIQTAAMCFRILKNL